VLTPEEVVAVIQQMSGVHRLIVQLLYGSGLRLREAMQLRIKDLDFAQHKIVVRDAKGQNSRVTMLPERIVQPLQCFPHLLAAVILAVMPLFGITYMRVAYKRQSSELCVVLACKSGWVVTRFAIVLRHICCKVATIFAPYKNYWATKM
jgi:hypothetical protein